MIMILFVEHVLFWRRLCNINLKKLYNNNVLAIHTSAVEFGETP